MPVMSHRWRPRATTAAASAVVVLGGLALWAGLRPGGGAMPPHPMKAEAPQPLGAGDVVRSEHPYRLPASLKLQGVDGRNVTLEQALFDGRPLVLHFMFSSCSTICPVTNQTLVAMQQTLGPRSARVHAVSLTIDPDHDTVQRLQTYARQSGRDGSFYTSDPATSEAVQRSFDVWRGDKMNHPSVFLVSAGAGRPWVRLEGTVLPRHLLEELARMGAL